MVQFLVFVLITCLVKDLEAKPAEYQNDLVKKTKCGELKWTIGQLNNPVVQKLNKNNNNDSSNGVKVWWPSLERCVDLTTETETNFCLNGKPVIIDGKEGTCECYGGAAALQGACYKYYEQGPCANGEVVTHDEHSKKAVCSEDLCAVQNAGIIQGQDRYVPLNGDGPCYQLSSVGPCNSSEVLEISSKNLPSCAPDFRPSFIPPVPPCYVSKQSFNCRIQVTLASEDKKSKFIDTLKADLE